MAVVTVCRSCSNSREREEQQQQRRRACFVENPLGDHYLCRTYAFGRRRLDVAATGQPICSRGATLRRQGWCWLRRAGPWTSNTPLVGQSSRPSPTSTNTSPLTALAQCCLCWWWWCVECRPALSTFHPFHSSGWQSVHCQQPPPSPVPVAYSRPKYKVTGHLNKTFVIEQFSRPVLFFFGSNFTNWLFRQFFFLILIPIISTVESSSVKCCVSVHRLFWPVTNRRLESVSVEQ